MQPDLSLLIVFTAGLLSFLSPCVLPLIPGYIAFVAGLPVNNIPEGQWTNRELLTAMVNSALFVFGFTMVFVALGASATWLGGLLVRKLPLLVNTRRCDHHYFRISADRTVQVRIHAVL